VKSDLGITGMIERIVSGGQTGVDRAALDAARAWGIPCGGWCPAGRGAEDGIIPDIYPLRETPVDPRAGAPADSHAERTRFNVRDSDATLIIAPAPCRDLKGGTRTTIDAARELAKPLLVIELDLGELDPGVLDPGELDFGVAPLGEALGRLGEWVGSEAVCVLNVAGPRESEHKGISRAARNFLDRYFRNNLP
jgi:hypothetical protein